ncbi:hypothetical protein BGZ63DRAFT_162298 [Mariannaea sp. PMI_226]|nr:hypothetical protein BGZ63DRAFT_162298 [Mariannaea sp. PMI_226]
MDPLPRYLPPVNSSKYGSGDKIPIWRNLSPGRIISPKWAFYNVLRSHPFLGQAARKDPRLRSPLERDPSPLEPTRRPALENPLRISTPQSGFNAPKYITEMTAAVIKAYNPQKTDNNDPAASRELTPSAFLPRSSSQKSAIPNEDAPEDGIFRGNSADGTVSMADSIDGTVSMANSVDGTVSMADSVNDTISMAHSVNGTISMANSVNDTISMANTARDTISRASTPPGWISNDYIAQMSGLVHDANNHLTWTSNESLPGSVQVESSLKDCYYFNESLSSSSLSKYYLPKILLRYGPLHIDVILKLLRRSMPEFSTFEAQYAKDRVEGVLQGLHGLGGFFSEVKFVKVCPACWNAKIVGHRKGKP